MTAVWGRGKPKLHQGHPRGSRRWQGRFEWQSRWDEECDPRAGTLGFQAMTGAEWENYGKKTGPWEPSAGRPHRSPCGVPVRRGARRGAPCWAWGNKQDRCRPPLRGYSRARRQTHRHLIIKQGSRVLWEATGRETEGRSSCIWLFISEDVIFLGELDLLLFISVQNHTVVWISLLVKGRESIFTNLGAAWCGHQQPHHRGTF